VRSIISFSPSELTMISLVITFISHLVYLQLVKQALDMPNGGLLVHPFLCHYFECLLVLYRIHFYVWLVSDPFAFFYNYYFEETVRDPCSNIQIIEDLRGPSSQVGGVPTQHIPLTS
jgi:hypothetical protein